MQNNSIKRRLELLEHRTPKEGVKLLFVEALPEEDKDFKASSGYILNKCKNACSIEICERALGNALVSLTGENPLLSNTIRCIVITREIAREVVKNLRSSGLEVSC